MLIRNLDAASLAPLLILCLCLLLGPLACEQGLAPPPPRQQERAAVAAGAPGGGQVHADRAGGIRFGVPPGLDLREEHFPGVTEPGVIRHIYTFSAEGTERLRLELWHNPGRRPLAAWFEQHLAFMRDGLARVSWGPVAPEGPTGLHFAWPRSEQAAGQRIVLFPLGELVVRVTCQDGADPALVAAFRALVGSIALREARP